VLTARSAGFGAVSPARRPSRRGTGFAHQLLQTRFVSIGVESTELLKGGGSVKCCTLEVHT
jgi:N-dimethylarginine dimethylaminohydrolase